MAVGVLGLLVLAILILIVGGIVLMVLTRGKGQE